MNVLENVACIHLDVRLWSGQRQLRPTDLKLAAGSEIPPATLARLGSKRLCDPDALAPGVTYKKRAERQLDAVGVRFLSGWAVPLDRLDPVDAALTDLWRAADAWKRTFLADYDRLIQDWIAANPGWEDLIRRAVEPVERIRGRIRFGHQIFRAAPVAADAVDDRNAGLATATARLGRRLLNDIARQAHALWLAYFLGRDQVTRRALRPLQAMGEKLEGFSFINPVVTPLVERIRLGLAALPATGPIEGNDLNAFAGLLFLLSDPDRMRAHGQAVLAGRPATGDEALAPPPAWLTADPDSASVEIDEAPVETGDRATAPDDPDGEDGRTAPPTPDPTAAPFAPPARDLPSPVAPVGFW